MKFALALIPLISLGFLYCGEASHSKTSGTDVFYYGKYECACRIHSKTNTGIRGQHYEIKSSVSHHKCAEHCSADHNCKAFEYTEKNQYCELWKVHPTECSGVKNGISCKWKMWGVGS